MLLNNFRHWQQQHEDDCLVACCKMVLDYLGIAKSEAWLWQRLKTGEVTPFPNVAKLADELGLTVEVTEWGELTTFGAYIESGLPILVAVNADDPQYWPYVPNHAVVIVGFDEQFVFVNDPAHPEMPLEIGIDTFLLAWSSRNYEYAVIRLAAEA